MNRDGFKQRRTGLAGIAKIPRSLVRIVSSHSRSPNVRDHSEDFSPPQEAVSKISIPTTQKQTANSITLNERSTRTKTNLAPENHIAEVNSSRKPPSGSNGGNASER